MTETPTPQPPIQEPARGSFRLNRLNIVLVALLVVQAAAAVYLFWPSSTAAAAEPLFGDLAMEDVTGLTITDNSDRTITLDRNEDGWVVAGTDGYPARTQTITTTLESLLAMNTNRLVTSTPTSHNRLEVTEDTYQRRIDLMAGDTTHTLYMGSSAGPGSTHIRLADQDATYLTGEIAAYEIDARPSNWIDITYFNVSQDAIAEFTVENDNGSLVFMRDGDSWTMEGLDLDSDQEFLPNNVTTLVNRLNRINITRPLGTSEEPEYGFDDPSATVEVHVEPEEGEPADYTFTFGAKHAEENVYYFKGSNSPYYVLIAGANGDDFAQKQRSDFIRTVTPEPEEGGTIPEPTGEPQEATE